MFQEKNYYLILNHLKLCIFCSYDSFLSIYSNIENINKFKNINEYLFYLNVLCRLQLPEIKIFVDKSPVLMAQIN